MPILGGSRRVFQQRQPSESSVERRLFDAVANAAAECSRLFEVSSSHCANVEQMRFFTPYRHQGIWYERI
jgi:hypothetical protein